MSAVEGPVDWYKDAIIYELHVRAFSDSNGDGIGDFGGLTARLDYLQQLGITAIWLLPFYPSPMRDGGYDISAYTSINPEYGTMRDFSRFVREAHRRGLRVITEIVVNHTSDQHPWFQRARQAPIGSRERDWYVWSDTDTQYAGTRVIFTDTETSNWAWDPVAGQYYWHRFFGHQPDLNYANPRVRQAVLNVMKFWLDRGVDGLRLDAVPYLCERDGTNNENLPETHEVIREWRAFVDEHYPGRMLLAEANQWPEDVRAYFGDDDECHMAFHFPIMPRLYMALRQEDRLPISDIMARTPDIPPSGQWALFLRNHDELTLEMVTDEERDYMYSVYATDPRMRVNVGIRRRLAPLLQNNRRAIELLHGLLFSLPGTPILYYGDEIGMGDNVFLGDRDGVRTPMQWNGDRNAGFSRADPASLYLPLILDPLYGYQAVNVEAQERSASSLLNWMRRMIVLRSRRPTFGRGTLTMLHPANRAVLAFLRQYEGETTLVVANLSRFVQPVELDLAEFAGTTPVEVIGQQRFPAVEDAPYFLSLGPHAFFWFDLVAQPEVPQPVQEGEGPLVFVEGDWPLLMEPAGLIRLAEEAIPAFLGRQRWFASDETSQAVTLRCPISLRTGASPAWLVLADVEGAHGVTTYVLTLAVATGRAAHRVVTDIPNAAVVRVRSARGTGVLYDATASDAIAREFLDLFGSGRTLEGDGATLRGEVWPAFRELHEALDDPIEVTRGAGEQSNTTIRFGQQIIVKLLRRLEPEPHPELEVGRHLMRRPDLVPRLAGVVRLEEDGRRAPVAVAHEYVWSRDNGWDFTLAAARRFLDEHVGEEPSGSPDLIANVIGPDYAEYLSSLGATTADLHRELADARGNPAFAPEPLTEDDVVEVVSRIGRRLSAVDPALRRLAEGDEEAMAAAASAVRGLAAQAEEWATDARRLAEDGTRIRVHGDYHLGQVLVTDDRFVVLDFGGEVGLPIEERREKASPLTDVAGMLRSLSYASLMARANQAQMYPDVQPAVQRLESWIALWEEQAMASFLAGYLEASAASPHLPAWGPQQRLLLDLYLLDKALHELQYELEHRPDWVWIPLEGLARIAAELSGGGA